MKIVKKAMPVVLAAVMGIFIAASLKADPLRNMQGAQVFLQKARMTAAVQAKNENLAKAKELLTVTAYDGGGHRAAALVLIMQATGKVNEFKLDKANQLIDMAIVKVKHSIQAIIQETAAKNKKTPQKK